MAARLMVQDHLRMVGHLQCIARRCIKSFGGQKGGQSEPPRTPPAYGPVLTQNFKMEPGFPYWPICHRKLL